MGKEVAQSFSDILKEFLALNDLTQTAFALAIGVKQSQVSEWLHEKAKPSYDLLRKMALTYNVSADYFLGIADTF
ncbi:MAG: helix-turn-helix domain-containing protein [Clostridiales bacterium]|nr:helix-turn-helix domain-containing protein [Clostridiales bacterium]